MQALKPKGVFFCDIFHLTNIVKFGTCFTKSHTSFIDLILTNKSISFNRALVSETDLYQKPAITIK